MCIRDSNKADGYHAGLAQKWVGLFEENQHLENGMSSSWPKDISSVKVHASKLKGAKQPLLGDYMRASTKKTTNTVVTLQTSKSHDANFGQEDKILQILNRFVNL